MSTGERLREYVRASSDEQAGLRQTKDSDSPLRKLTKNAVPVRYRGTARMLVTDLMVRRERARAAQIPEPLHLHLGSGGEHKDGWTNVDLAGDPVEVAWNLARPLPFADGSAAAVFHEHLLEHLPLAAGARLLAECLRVLRPGGLIRVGVPDAGRLARSYAGDGEYLERLHPGRPTRMLALQELFYWHRHLTMFDAETLAFLLEEAGFEHPVERGFGETALAAAPDTERRRAETLYMEAVKPGT